MTLTLSGLTDQLVSRGWQKHDTSSQSNPAAGRWCFQSAADSLDGSAWISCTPPVQIHGHIAWRFNSSGALEEVAISTDGGDWIVEWPHDRLPSLDAAIEVMAKIPGVCLLDADLSPSVVNQLRQLLPSELIVAEVER